LDFIGILILYGVESVEEASDGLSEAGGP